MGRQTTISREDMWSGNWLRYARWCAWTILVAVASASWATEPPNETLITVKTPTGTLIQAELADTALKRAQGLMFREHIADDRGMLFIFGDAQPWTFWMKNTKIPLDIIWMDAKKPSSILSGMSPSARGRTMAVLNTTRMKGHCTSSNLEQDGQRQCSYSEA